MDAAGRTELDALRGRAYGPEADIYDDPEALARLIELEDLARQPGSVPSRDPQAPVTAVRDVLVPPIAVGAEAVAQPMAPPDAQAAAEPAGPRRPKTLALRGAVIALAAAAVAAIVVAGAVLAPAGREAPAASPKPTPTADAGLVLLQEAGSQRLMTLWLNRSFGTYTDASRDVQALPFPASTRLKWATPLGEYYGWMLWVAGGGDYPASEHCIMIIRGIDVRARCAAGAEQSAGALHVSLSASDVAPAEQPQPLDGDDRIRFWWLHDDSIEVLLAPFPPD